MGGRRKGEGRKGNGGRMEGEIFLNV